MARGFKLSRGAVRVGGIVLPGGVTLTSGSGAPTDGTSGTGAGAYARGSEYTDTDTGITYSNVGTQASPVWQKSQDAVFHSASASKSPSASASPS